MDECGAVGRMPHRTTLVVAIVIPIFGAKVEGLAVELLSYNVYLLNMDQVAMMITLIFTFLLGAGIGFYVARFIIT